MPETNKPKNPRSRANYLRNLDSYRERKGFMNPVAQEIESLLLRWESLVYYDIDEETIDYLRSNEKEFISNNEKEEEDTQHNRENCKNNKISSKNSYKLIEVSKSNYIDSSLQNYRIVSNDCIKFDKENNNSVQLTKQTKNIVSFLCSIPNCGKQYTSSYGLSYHHKHGHKEDVDPTKKYKCFYVGCKKRYKNPNGLQYHIRNNHKS
ncbi:zinc finger protein [Tubulinosema ratisbonensis]|uniref:Zinc finger protein n=1 Tax=Tubulinosema ratisbonensis TaxID=291195 RepID=A0A437AMA5_9MICR|nr:zinc finger protein [Tubulinosema ratisbonensis]